MTVRCPHLALLVRGGGRRACQKVVVQAVEVLLRLYAKCLADDETIANTRIDLTVINLVRTYPVI